MSIARRNKSRNPFARIARIWALLKLGLKAFRVFKRVRPGLKFVPFAIVAAVIMRIRGKKSEGSQATYSPPVSATVPSTPPADADATAGGGTREAGMATGTDTQTERRFKREKAEADGSTPPHGDPVAEEAEAKS